MEKTKRIVVKVTKKHIDRGIRSCVNRYHNPDSNEKTCCMLDYALLDVLGTKSVYTGCQSVEIEGQDYPLSNRAQRAIRLHDEAVEAIGKGRKVVKKPKPFTTAISVPISALRPKDR